MSFITKKPFTEWILVFAKLYFLPIGRIGRIEFLISFMTVLFIAYIAVYLPGTLFTIKKSGADIISYTLPPGKEYISQLVNIGTIFCVWILLVNSIKRLRDLESKTWYAIFTLIPLINIFVFVGLLFSEGTVGINQYGPQKKPLSL